MRPEIRDPFERVRLRAFFTRQLDALQCPRSSEVRDLAAVAAQRDLLLAMWRPLVGDATVRAIDMAVTKSITSNPG
ncbi:hypothetical protein BH09PLA1_BH09PLA1_25960 [soil metagenome]